MKWIREGVGELIGLLHCGIWIVAGNSGLRESRDDFDIMGEWRNLNKETIGHDHANPAEDCILASNSM